MRLRRERKKAKLTQSELARFSGVAQGTISKIELGAMSSPGFETLHKLAWALKKFGRKVEASELQPARQPVLVKGAFVPRRKRGVVERKRRRIA